MITFFLKNKINFSFLFISFFGLIAIIGVENISFYSIEWLHNGQDASLHQIGWYFFKNDIWRFPLGSNPYFGEGFGSSIVYTDSIPFFALIFKLIKFFIPGNFQYFSLWYFLCLYLQLFFAFKILKEFTNSDIYSFVGSLFFIISPFFLYRVGFHASVSAHWILLAALYLSLTYKIHQSKLSWLLLIIFSSLISYSFTAMLLLLYSMLRLFNFFYEKENFLIILKDFFIIIIFLLLTLYIVGYFQISMTDTLGVGFGVYKMNLLSIFDPTETYNKFYSSWFLPDIILPRGEELEGFNYIGIGSIIMLTIIFISSFNKDYRKKIFLSENIKNIKILTIISFFFALWALSNKISFGSYTLVEIPLNKFFLALLSVAKNTGRMFWIVNYFILITLIIIIFKTFDKKKSLLIIILIFSIQLADTSPIVNSRFNKIKSTEAPKLNDNIWETLFKKHEIVNTTNPKSWSPLFTTFSPMMEKYNTKKTNLVIHARANRKAIAEERYSLYKNLREKKLNSKTLYIIDGLGHLRNLKYLYQDDKTVSFINGDNFWSLVLNEKEKMRNSDIKKLANIELKLLEINKQENLGIRKHDSYLGLGWTHNSGKQGVWSDGPVSSLLFKTDENYKNFELEVFSLPYTTERNKIFEFDVYVNDLFNSTIKLEKAQKRESFKILIKKNPIKNNEVKVDFYFSNLISPLDELKSPDSRKLGILIKKIILVVK